MRTRNDRIRHAIGFEVIGLLIAAPLSSWITGIELSHMGPLAVLFSVLATVWNYVYNIGFDKLLLKYQGTRTRPCGSAWSMRSALKGASWRSPCRSSPGGWISPCWRRWRSTSAL